MALSLARRRVVIAAGAAAALLGSALSPSLCLRAWIADGIAVPVCPDGQPHQEITLTAEGWVRGKPGRVRIAATARYTTAEATAPRPRRSAASARSWRSPGPTAS